jgi:hypothetical protein
VPHLVKDFMKDLTGSQTILQTRLILNIAILTQGNSIYTSILLMSLFLVGDLQA